VRLPSGDGALIKVFGLIAFNEISLWTTGFSSIFFKVGVGAISAVLGGSSTFSTAASSCFFYF
jgi:hypothetical protein